MNEIVLKNRSLYPMVFKKITAIFMGMSSGLLYGLLTSTLTAYFIDIQIELAAIGFLTLRMLPYSFKYLWSPLIDSTKIKIFSSDLGQRKSWMVFTQISLIILMICLSFTSTQDQFLMFCILCFLLAFFAATYDIAMEAYRIELFGDERNSTGNFLVILGFRFGLVFSSVLALYLASIIKWRWMEMDFYINSNADCSMYDSDLIL